MDVPLAPLIAAADKKRMNVYEKHMWSEILEWEYENHEGIWNYCTTVTTNALKNAIATTGSAVPKSVTNTLKAAIEKTLRACLNGGLYTSSKEQVIARANELFGREFSDISQLKGLELEQLDELASSYASTNQLFALLEGAGMGLGGVIFIAADIPTLITINFRLLVQLAYIYGIDANDPRERQYLMNIMTLASAEQKERHDIFCRLDQQAKVNAQLVVAAIQIQETIVNEILLHAVGAAHRIALRLTHAKLLQLLPLLGLAIGAGANYAFTREVTTFGMNLLRKRWLMDKYKLFEEVLEYRAEHLEKLMTSWVLTPANGEVEGEYDLEFEEDFLLDAPPPHSLYDDADDDTPPAVPLPLPLPAPPPPTSPAKKPLFPALSQEEAPTNPSGLQQHLNSLRNIISSPINRSSNTPNNNSNNSNNNSDTDDIYSNNSNHNNNNNNDYNGNNNNSNNTTNSNNANFNAPYTPPTNNNSNYNTVYANANFYKALLAANNPSAFSANR